MGNDMWLSIMVMMSYTKWWPKVSEQAEELDKLLINVNNFSMQTWALIIAGGFTVFSLCLSSYLLQDHLSGYNNPNEQKWLIGIILMVPVYTVTSYLSLWKPRYAVYIETLGECYEAFALYSFGRYLIACLGEEEMAITRLAKQGSEGMHHSLLLDEISGCRSVVHPAPLKWCLEPWQLGQQFYNTTKFGIVQYIIIKVLGSCAALILEIFDKYGEGDFDFSKGYPYITVVQNFSQLWALYCLVQFYQVTKHELHQINPLAKFLCFKAVVFVTWWQGVVIALLFATGVATQWLPYKPSDDCVEQLQTSLQDFIVCIEMAIAAVAHIYVYPATPYQHVDSRKQDLNSFGSVADVIEEDLEIAATSVQESIQDVVMGGGGHVVEDVRITVSQAVEPVETSFTKVNEAVHNNMTKMNESLHEKATKFNETFHETVQHWGRRQKEEISKEGTYIIDDEDDMEIVETKQNLRVEKDTKLETMEEEEEEDDEVAAAVPSPSLILRKEVSGSMTRSSCMKPGENAEKISYKQQKERSNSFETKETITAKEKTNDVGERQQEEKLKVSERRKGDGNGEDVCKETMAEWVRKNDKGDMEITEEFEEINTDMGGNLVKHVKKEVHTEH